MLTSDEENFLRSMYLEAQRPQLPRQRSNSLPIGLALMNAEEAGIIFSAAEKAAARRRRVVSINTSLGNDSPSDESEATPLRMSSTIKPSSQQPITPLSVPTSANAQVMEPKRTMNTKALHLLESALKPPNPVVNYSKPLILGLPLSPISPSQKRVAASPSLKDYADNLYMYTQAHLTTAYPQILLPTIPNTPPEEIFKELVSPTRPPLKSHFSEWSDITDNDEPSGHSNAVGDDDKSVLMSPDSFFGSFDETPTKDIKQTDNAKNRLSTMSRASSETYSPRFAPSLSTPSSAYLAMSKPGDADFSYFTNFEHYMKPGDYRTNIAIPKPVEPEIVPDLTPIELLEHSPITPPSVSQHCVEIAMTDPVGPMAIPLAPQILRADTTTTTAASGAPCDPANTPAPVPNYLIGALG